MRFSRTKYCKCCPIQKMWGHCENNRKKLCKATWRTLTKSEKEYLMKEVEYYEKKKKAPKEKLTYKQILENNFAF